MFIAYFAHCSKQIKLDVLFIKSVAFIEFDFSANKIKA